MAAGSDGVVVLDLRNPYFPIPVTVIATGVGFASGVRVRKHSEGADLYIAACSHVAHAQLDASGQVKTITVSPKLDHRNAKDAHGNDRRIVVANNGRGVWFFDAATLAVVETFDDDNPNFYANSVEIFGGTRTLLPATVRFLLSMWSMSGLSCNTPKIL